MTNQSYDEQSLPEEIYSSPTISKKYIFFFLILFAFTAIFIFPWHTLFKIPNLAQITGCPMQHSPISANFFPPGLYLKNLSIPSSCSGTRNALNIQNLVVGIGGMSFSPFGPVVNIKGDLEQFPLQAKLAIGFNQVSLSSYYDKLPLKSLNNLLSKLGALPIVFEGHVKLDLRFSILEQQLNEYRLDVTSQDLNLPSQMVTFLKVPDLPLKKLHVSLQGKKNNLSIDNITLGSHNNLFLHTKGNMLLDFQMMTNSQINLDTELKLSHALNQEFGLLSNFLNKNKIAEGQFKMKISGTLGSPIF